MGWTCKPEDGGTHTKRRDQLSCRGENWRRPWRRPRRRRWGQRTAIRSWIWFVFLKASNLTNNNIALQ